ncbi:MAG: cadherin domain-containing protein [Erythrobacter sp.]
MTAELSITLARAEELGLTKRHRSDWFGGFNFLIDNFGPAGTFEFGFQIDLESDKLSRLIGVDGQRFQDTVDASRQTLIQGGELGETIRITAGYGPAANPVLEDAQDFLIDGLQVSASQFEIDSAAIIEAGGGNDEVHAGDLGTTVLGESGDDTLYGGRLDDWLVGGFGDDRLDAGAQSGGLGGDGNYLDGGAGNDELFGREGSDWLEGGDGIDILRAGDGGDVLSGGAGTGDQLFGGGGDDTYLLRVGDGADIADDVDVRAPEAPVVTNPSHFLDFDLSDPIAARFAAILEGSINRDWLGTSAAVSAGQTAAGEDSIAFGYGIGIGDVRLTRSADGNDLIVQIMQIGEDGSEEATGDQLTVRGWFTSAFRRVEWLKFVDGTEIRIGDMTSFVAGTSGDDVLIGTNGNDFVYGGAGDDELRLLAGDDVGNGGTGNDLVAGDDGRDLLIGGLGNDRLIGGRGSDAITGDAGADDIYGGDDDDIISGGRGDGDLLVGGKGDDVFKYARGDGHDTIFDDYAADYWQVAWTSAGGWNTALGYTRDPVTTEVTGPNDEYIYKNIGTAAEPDLQWIGRFDFDATNGALRVFAPPAGATDLTRDAGEDTIEFGLDVRIQDIVLYNPQGTDDLVLQIGQDGAGGSGSSDSITLNSWYSSPGAIEKLAFYSTGLLEIDPSKRRLIAGTDGNDDGVTAPLLAGSAINDWITGGAGDDVVAGGDGDDILGGNSGFDTIKGEGGNDVLYGGSGNDILDGGTGADILSGGAGQDAASYASSFSAVTVHLSAAFANTSEARGDEFSSIENLIGSGDGDVLGGDDFDNELTGGKGNDTLSGNLGDDTYVWNIGDGADLIVEGSFVVEEAVTSSGALADGYGISRWQPTGAVDPVSGFRYWQLQVEGPQGQLVYDSSGFLARADETPLEPLPSGFIQSGWLDGFVRASNLTNAQQVTAASFDTSVDGGFDILEFGSGITLDDLTFAWSGPDLTISYLGQAHSQVTLKGQSTANSAVEEILFSDGLGVSLASIVMATNGQVVSGDSEDNLVLGRSGALADQLVGGAGDDVLVGYAGDDTLSGGSGNDVIDGGEGADTIDGGADDGGAGDTVRYSGSVSGITVDLARTGAQGGNNTSDAYGDTLRDIESVVGSDHADFLAGNAYNNRLFGGAGNDTINGIDGDNVLDGGDGDDSINGGTGEDNISGGRGGDTIYALDGNDIVSGGDGNDSIYGGAGEDQIVGDAGNDHLHGNWGNDTLIGGGGGDVIVGGDGDDIIEGGAGNDWLQGDAGNDSYLLGRFSGQDTIAETGGVNTVAFAEDVRFDELWITRAGSDLRVEVMGGDTVLTVSGFFLGSGVKPIRSIQTSTHGIFVDHPATLALIDAMTAFGSPPAKMPASLTDMVSTYWHEGGRSAPTAPDAPRQVQLDEDTSINLDGDYGVIDHDRNIVSYSIIPGREPQLGEITNLDPATGALTYTPFADANGEDSFTLLATDADGFAAEVPVQLTIDAVNDAPRDLRIHGGGLSVAETAPSSGTQEGTPIGRFTAIDAEGGEIQYSLVDDLDERFLLDPTGQLFVRNAALLDYEAADEYTIQITATDPEGLSSTESFTVTIENVNEAPDQPMRIADGSVPLPILSANEFAGGDWPSDPAAIGLNNGELPAGWTGWNRAETKWQAIDGPYSSGVSADTVALNLTNTDADSSGGIAMAPTMSLESSKAYEYTIYFRKNTDSDVRFIFGPGNTPDRDGNNDLVPQFKKAGNGQENPYPRFLDINTDSQWHIDPFTQGKWYKLVGYVLPAGSQTLDSGQTHGGVYDTETGTKVYDTQSLIWSEGAQSTDVVLSLATTNHTNSDGSDEILVWSPEVRQVALTDILSNDEPLDTATEQARFGFGSTVAAPNDENTLVGEFISGDGASYVGTTVATFALSDPDGPTPSLRLVAGAGNNPEGLFQVNGNQIEFAHEPDFEELAALGYDVLDSDGDGFGEVTLTGQVEAFDGELSSTAPAGFTVLVEDVNEQPTALALANRVSEIEERDQIAAGTARPTIVLGQVSVSDLDLPGQLTSKQTFAVYEGNSTAASTRFAVNAVNELVLLANQSLDFEIDGASITLTVRATDQSSAPLSIEQSFTFSITDIHDILEGTANADTLVGGVGTDFIYGFGGNDTLRGLGERDALYGGDGNDSLYGGDAIDFLDGESGNDRLFGEDGDDFISGGTGNDVLDGGAGDDDLYGQDGNEGVRASGSNPLRGFISAGLIGGVGNDRLDGGGGDDFLNGGTGADQLIGGAGFDGVTYGTSSGRVTVNLALGTGRFGDAEGDTLSEIELLEGSNFDDHLTGSAGNDVLIGGDGDDTLIGYHGDDKLVGGAGNDILDAQNGNDYLDGGAGDDTLYGGSDSDVYFFARGDGNDTIVNYDPTNTDFDLLAFDATITYGDIWFERVSNDLKLTVLGNTGSDGSVMVRDWFTMPDRDMPDNYFKLDLIADGTDRATQELNVDALVAVMAGVPAGSRPQTLAEMQSLRESNSAFNASLGELWGRLSAPKISDTGTILGIEPLDDGTTQVTFSVRAWFEDEDGLGIEIPASNIDLSLITPSGVTLADYVIEADYGTPDAAGNRTVTLTLEPNASTHLLLGGSLQLDLRATIRGTTRTADDAGGIALSIAPTADTGVFTQLESVGGNAGSLLPITVSAATPDTAGSETLDVLVRGVPSGYSLVKSSGASVGQYEGGSNNWWRLQANELAGLRLKTPAGSFQDAQLSFAVQTQDGGSVRTSAWTPLRVVVNGAPTGISLSGSVNENATNGTLVGLLSATDPDTAEGEAAPSRFELLNDAGGRYMLDPNNSRRLLVNNGGSNINYEASDFVSANTITVRAFDDDDSYVDRQIAVTVNNVNEQNNLPSSHSMQIDEGVGIGTEVGRVTATDPDSSSSAFGQQRYSFFYNNNTHAVSSDGRYRINATTGRITTNTGLNFEAGDTSQNYTVVARDNAGAGGYKQDQTTITISIQNINEQNSLPSSYSMSVDENEDVGTIVGQVAASDPDSSGTAFGQQRYYFRNGSSTSSVSSDGRYHINAVSGRITTGVELNFEAGNTSQNYTVVARDNQGTGNYTEDTTMVTIGVKNVNEQNNLSYISNKTVRENLGAGHLVTTVSASDLDSSSTNFGKQRYYFLNGNSISATSADGRFTINATNGRVTTRSSFNFETISNPVGSYTVVARDNVGAGGYTQSTRTFNISITDENEIHTLSNRSGSIAENVPLSPQTVPNAFNLRNTMLNDPEGRGMTWSFEDGSTESGIWQISADGKVTLKAGIADYEEITTRYEEQIIFPDPPGGIDPFEPVFPEPVTVYVPVRDHSLATQVLSIKAKDVLGRSVTGNFTATITNVNEGPALSSARTFYVRDDQGEGYLGKISGVDPETGAAATSFRIISVAEQEVARSRGNSSDVDNTGNPYVTVAGSGSSAGNLYFQVPGDGEWEGGIKRHPTLGGRWYYQLNYVMQVGLRDASGVENVEEVTIIFKKHNTSAVLPIALDLDGDGLELVDYDTSNVFFDMDLDGIADRTGWIGADDALLALDRNGNGLIDDSSEISYANDLDNALTDLEGLRAFDTNNNGFLDAGDERFDEFLVWQDANQNGVSDDGELRSLNEVGIVQINLTLNLTGEEPADDRNVISATSDFIMTDGSLGLVGDTSFAFEPSKEIVEETIPLPDDIDLIWHSADGVVDNLEALEGGGENEDIDDASPLEFDDEEFGLAAPIVLDFDGDGSRLVSIAQSATTFDQDGDGELERTGWIAAGDALLALDRNSNGSIDNIAEISFLEDKEGAQTDLEGLAAFDSNLDGILDARDERFVEFRLWFDRNTNGVTDAGELLSLAEAGLASISLEGTPTGETVTPGQNIVYNETEFTLDSGETGTALDSGFAFIRDAAIQSTGLTGNQQSAAIFESSALSLDRKSKKYRAFSMGGELVVLPRRGRGEIDPRAGIAGTFTEISFPNRTYGYLSTLVLDLDGDGIEHRRFSKSKARFDMNGDGVGDDTGWTKSRDAFLVIDRNENGRIDDGSELSFTLDAPNARSGMQGLAAFDSNNDGLISALDERFGELKVWADADRNGRSAQGELRSPSEHGIASISLQAVPTEQRSKVGRNLLLATAIFNRTDGSTGTLGDLAIGFKPASQPVARPGGSDLASFRRSDHHGTPRIDEMSIQDILREDFFKRFEDTDFAPQIHSAGSGLGDETGVALASPETIGVLRDRAEASQIAGTEMDGATTTNAQDANRERMLARIMQDMAAFGDRGGLDDELRHRSHAYPLADFYS